MTRKQLISLILLGAAVIYDVLPYDIIPDIPFIGWIDDGLLTVSAALNCLEQFGDFDTGLVPKILKWLKWICILLAILILIFGLLFATAFVALIKS